MLNLRVGEVITEIEKHFQCDVWISSVTADGL